MITLKFMHSLFYYANKGYNTLKESNSPYITFIFGKSCKREVG